MKITSKLAMLAVASCLALASNSALAKMEGAAQISLTGWRLLDLDANDGITPDIRLTSTQAVASALFYIDPTFRLDDGQLANSLEPLTASVALANTGAQAALNSAGFQSALQIDHAGILLSSAFAYEFFTLTPHTRLEYVGSASIAATGDGKNIEGGDNSSALMSNTVWAGWSEPSSGTGTNLNTYTTFDQIASLSSGLGHSEFDGGFVISYDNNGNDYFDGSLMVGSQVLAVVQVPEPETYAMMLGGLALLGVLARRRQRS